MPFGKKRTEAVKRGVGGAAYYFVAILAALVLTPLMLLRWLADVLYQLVFNKEGFSDDGYIPRAQHRLDGFRDWAYYGEDSGWNRR